MRAIIFLLTLIAIAVIGCDGRKPVVKTKTPPKTPIISKPVVQAETPSQTADQAASRSADSKQSDQSAAQNATVAASSDPQKSAEQTAAAADSADSSSATAAEKSEASTTPVESVVDAQAASADTPAPTEPQPAPQRVMLLAPGGPLLIDLVLTIDGRPHDEVLKSVVQDALTGADADQDGKTTWEEVTSDSRIRYGELGNLPSRDEDQRGQLMKMYDVNRNGLADEGELRRFLTRNAAASKSFNLRSSNYYRDANRWESPVRLLLDADEDGALNSDELAACVSKMKARDADDDDVLALDDLIEITPEDIGPLQRRRSNQTESALHLNDADDWGQVLFTLEEMYSLGQSLDATSFTREPQMFTELDANRDGELRSDDMHRLLEVTPHLILEMAFGKKAEASENTQPLMRLVGHPRDLPVEIVESATTSRLTCAWSDVTVVFFARDEGMVDYLALAKTQIMQYDGNKDGYLEKTELPEFFSDMVADFDVLDADDDEKIYAEELATFQDKQGATMRSQLRARAGEDRDALYTALDEDHDGRLTARELSRAATRMTSMDQDHDGMIVVDEIPTAMLLGVVRANPQQDDQLFVPPTAAQQLAEKDVPEWFTSMDVNGDGEISRREFLGELSLFDQLDANNDAFLNFNEAVPKDTATPE